MAKIEIPTPPWIWRDFGTGLGLYTTTDGAKVVLVAAGAMRVRDETGLLVPITVDHPVAQLLAGTPGLMKACEDAESWIRDTATGSNKAEIAEMLRSARIGAGASDG